MRYCPIMHIDCRNAVQALTEKQNPSAAVLSQFASQWEEQSIHTIHTL